MTTTRPDAVASGAGTNWGEQSFIEVQFPVSKLSKESYKERKAVAGQTLTGLGKWWGRKPLVLVRALILGVLLPATDDPEADRETFLALMTMDDEGLLRRQTKSIPARVCWQHATGHERDEYFDETGKSPSWASGVDRDDRSAMQRRAFLRMSYDEKLVYCDRPEQIDGPGPEAWERINRHLGTSASDLPELVRELGERRWGHTPRVGDAFCGGGSIPFEAARIGCDAYGSDLSPVAALLTWGALNIVGGGEEAVGRVEAAQRRVYDKVQQQVDEWGIERNEQGWIADAYLYCNEVIDPVTGWRVPLAPSWVIATKTNVVAKLVPVPEEKRFQVEIHERVSSDEMREATDGTWSNGVVCLVDRHGRWLPPSQRQSTSAAQLRGRQGLRRWENDDLVPRPDDIFQERLYCIRWYDPATGQRHYRAPDDADIKRESQVLELLHERFHDWQGEGYIPSRRIEPGDKTDEPIRTRGWTHWHHLFNPRQLLLHGLFAEYSAEEPEFEQKALLLMMGRNANWNSRLCSWDTSLAKSGGIGAFSQTFYNQALNTLLNYGCRPMRPTESAYFASFSSRSSSGTSRSLPIDAREITKLNDAWITDPGYADAINYEELSEYFLGWYEHGIERLFPNWNRDSRRALAIRGTGADFRTTLAECYTVLVSNMSDNGYQVVMFTHQDPMIWADLTLVLWSAGLKVGSAWTVATETPASGVKGSIGNYVQGTVCMVLRKRRVDRHGELGDLFPQIQVEVERQLQTMLEIDPKDDPNFGDADLQLAAYAAALRVLTGYSTIGEIDIERELRRPSEDRRASPVTRLIEQAVKIASDYLVPDGLDRSTWRKMTPEERFYLKGLEVETEDEHREGVFQELARGYGAGGYRDLLGSTKANATRLKTPAEFAGRDLRSAGEAGFDGSLLRHILFGIHTTAANDERDPRPARDYLRRELPNYWADRQTIVELLRYISNKAERLPHWGPDTQAARLLHGTIANDSV